jgi:hypothetical protein
MLCIVRGKFVLCGLVRKYRRGISDTKELEAWSHRGDDPTVLIIVDTNDAGNRLEVSRDQQLLGVPGQEDPIH